MASSSVGHTCSSKYLPLDETDFSGSCCRGVNISLGGSFLVSFHKTNKPKTRNNPKSTRVYQNFEISRERKVETQGH
jgi:hypothetical protein